MGIQYLSVHENHAVNHSLYKKLRNYYCNGYLSQKQNTSAAAVSDLTKLFVPVYMLRKGLKNLLTLTLK